MYALLQFPEIIPVRPSIKDVCKNVGKILMSLLALFRPLDQPLSKHGHFFMSKII